MEICEGSCKIRVRFGGTNICADFDSITCEVHTGDIWIVSLQYDKSLLVKGNGIPASDRRRYRPGRASASYPDPSLGTNKPGLANYKDVHRIYPEATFPHPHIS